MTSIIKSLLVLMVALSLATSVHAEDNSPWGSAKLSPIEYQPQKVVYDVAVNSLDTFARILDRVSFLNNIYRANPFDSSIVLVLHGNEIPFFASKNYNKYSELMQRAKSLTVAGPIEFRMCRVAAEGHGFKPEDIHGFVTMVPMADAELIRLQQEEGYVYMQ